MRPQEGSERKTQAIVVWTPGHRRERAARRADGSKLRHTQGADQTSIQLVMDDAVMRAMELTNEERPTSEDRSIFDVRPLRHDRLPVLAPRQVHIDTDDATSRCVQVGQNI